MTTEKIRILTNASQTNDGYSRLTEVEAYTSTSGRGESGGVQWLISDQLGTPRLIADESGSLSGMQRRDYLPFPTFDITGLDNKKDENNAVKAEDVGDLPDQATPEAIKAAEELLKPNKEQL